MPLSLEFQEAVDTAKAGKLPEARAMLKQILRKDPTNEAAWFLYARIADTPEHAIVCLKKVLEYNPYNQRARQMLEELQPVNILEKTASDKEWDYNKYMEKQEKGQAASRKGPGISRNILLGIGGLLLVGLILYGGYYFTRGLFSAPKPVSTLALSAKRTETVDPCNCTEVLPYAERTVQRYNDMVDEMDRVNRAIVSNNLGRSAVADDLAKAQARYNDQHSEKPPPCMDLFNKKMVALFWNWQQALDALQKGDNASARTFMQNIIDQTYDISTLLNQLEGQLNGCPIPRPTPIGRTG